MNAIASMVLAVPTIVCRYYHKFSISFSSRMKIFISGLIYSLLNGVDGHLVRAIDGVDEGSSTTNGFVKSAGNGTSGNLGNVHQGG
jgi:hypothetical protein